MNPESLKESLGERLGENIDKIKKLSGGSTHPSFLISIADKKCFVKVSNQDNASLEKEVTGLMQLKKHGASTPEVIYFDSQFLVLDAIIQEPMGQSFWRDLGTQLAGLHKNYGESFGFVENNFIGAAPQKNIHRGAPVTWVEFFWENRIKYKLNELADKRSQQFSPTQIEQLKKSCWRLLENHGCQPSPLHGDLWSGNILCGESQKSFIIDPAFYYGDRETDLAMTECFGGFEQSFYETYQNLLPLEPGYDERKHLYNLYHMLNHWVIFGDSYKQAVQAIMDQLSV